MLVNELIKATMRTDEAEQPPDVRDLRWSDVRRLTFDVLAGRRTAHSSVEPWRAEARGDDDWLTELLTHLV
jgi:hypothetical protein